MSKRNPVLLIIDMLECLDNILAYTSRMSFESFLQHSKRKMPWLKTFKFLGEAANRLPEHIKVKYNKIEWSRIIRSRHMVTHEYAAIDYVIIWKIITAYAPPLQVNLQNLKTDLES